MEHIADITARQFLTFSLGGEYYALPVGCIREVLEPQRITKLPRTSPCIKGIIEVRGEGVPVIDLRILFGIETNPPVSGSAVIVVECNQLTGTHTVGLISDAVHEVVFLDSSQMDEAPQFGSRLSSDCVCGIGRYEDSFVLVLNLDELLNDEHVAMAFDQALVLQ